VFNVKDWLTQPDSPLSYMGKSIMGLLFSVIIINFALPDYMMQPLFSTPILLTRTVFFSLILASASLIIGGHITFNIYFALPYLLFNKYLIKKMEAK
jgi:hypothetical protein